ncbi:MAG TPA: DUF418 domain-containing protein [Candidatus Binatia bacterium]|nr:DUF418 domain-containing protein [Candidatus Binatia bacterium]
MPPPAPRLPELDALRGFAVLGILAVNIQSFAFVASARVNPTAQGDVGGAHWWAWWVTRVLADGKFIAIFAMLFGAGIVLMADRCLRRGADPARVHYRRMAVLFLVGLLHAYLVWYGDVLVTLAVAGSVAYLYRELPVRRLLVTGLVVYAVGSLAPGLIAWIANGASPASAGGLSSPAPDAIAWETSRYRGPWAEQMQHRAPTALRLQTSELALRSLWQLTGLMLVGAALFKSGFLTAERPIRDYVIMGSACAATGLPVVVWGVEHAAASGWTSRALAISDQANYWGGLPVALAWMAAVILLCRRASPPRGLVAVGRSALTNYLAQSVVCTSIFYGHGFGLFARIDRAHLLGLVVAIGLAQMVASVWWLRRFEQGPLEWLWRRLSYGSQARRRHDADQSVAGS